jgi:hypothetical protein
MTKFNNFQTKTFDSGAGHFLGSRSGSTCEVWLLQTLSLKVDYGRWRLSKKYMSLAQGQVIRTVTREVYSFKACAAVRFQHKSLRKDQNCQLESDLELEFQARKRFSLVVKYT